MSPYFVWLNISGSNQFHSFCFGTNGQRPWRASWTRVVKAVKLVIGWLLSCLIRRTMTQKKSWAQGQIFLFVFSTIKQVTLWDGEKVHLVIIHDQGWYQNRDRLELNSWLCFYQSSRSMNFGAKKRRPNAVKNVSGCHYWATGFPDKKVHDRKLV